MRPILFQIFGIPVYSYGFFVALGFSVATLSLYELDRKTPKQTDELVDLSLWILIASIVGARCFYVALHVDYYIRNPVEILLLNKGGLVFYGGLLGGVTAAWCYTLIKKISLIEMGDKILAVLPIAQMFGRIGCFMNSCCFGSPTLFSVRVTFPLNSYACDFYQELQPVHPVQLYESMGLGLLFLFLVTVYERRRFKGQVMVLYAVGYGMLRFTMEFLRGDNPKLALEWTLAQWISAGLILAGLYGYRRLAGKIS